MFRCQRCHDVSFPCEPATKIIVETRESPKHKGREIVREIAVCQTCATGKSRMAIAEKYMGSYIDPV